MFGKMINHYYYGKAGKGDFRKEDLPSNRWQLFWEMLRVRFSALVRMNAMTLIAFIPMILVIASHFMTFLNGVNLTAELTTIVQDAGVVFEEGMDVDAYHNLVTEALLAADRTQEEADFIINFNMRDFINTLLLRVFLFLVPCIAITGPVQAGMAYVTRNWARDEHAFVWSDFKDAVKDNWKQGLVVSFITGLMPFVVYVCWVFYGNLANMNGAIFVLPQILVAVLVLVWFMAVTYMYPMMVSYKAGIGTIIKNSFLMAIARLPYTVGARLVMLLPAIIAVLLFSFSNLGMYGMLALAAYYLIVGNALARFVYASVTNAAFDRLINIHMEGVQVDRGLSLEDDDDEDEEENLQA